MRYIIFGTIGPVSKQLVKQLVAKGHLVKVFGRDIDKWIDKDLNDKNFEAIKGYLFDEENVFDALKNVDVVFSCIGGSLTEVDKTRSLGIKNIVTQMQKRNIKRIVAIGGEGVLNAQDDTLLLDDKEYPENYKPLGQEHLKALEFLQKSSTDFTFVCPQKIIDADYTGNYILSVTYPPQPNFNEINAGDLADCMIKCVELNKYCGDKIGICKS